MRVGDGRSNDDWPGTPAAAADIRDQRTLYRFLGTGDIPAYKMGRVLRVRRNDLDAFLEKVRVQPGELRHLFPTKKAKAPVESIVDEP